MTTICEITEQFLLKTVLKKKTIDIRNFVMSGDVDFWTSPKGNFRITKSEGEGWDVYWELQFNPVLIKRNLLSADDLISLYAILTGGSLLATQPHE